MTDNPQQRSPEILNLALKFHETYERLAPEFGYETREDTKQFDPNSKNGRLMIAVCEEMMNKDTRLMSKQESTYAILPSFINDEPRPNIVCLCGSTRFMQAFHDAGWQYTLDGWIVLSVGVCKHVDADGGHGAEMIGPDVAEKLDELHLRKIDLADRVHVLNVDGYIGESTRKEIEYAESLGKPILYLDDPIKDTYADSPILARGKTTGP